MVRYPFETVRNRFADILDGYILTPHLQLLGSCTGLRDNQPEKQVDGNRDALKACKHVVGFCYTQITDVEQEKNGIYYYDRSAKFDTERLRKIFEKIPSIIQDPQDLSDWKK